MEYHFGHFVFLQQKFSKEEVIKQFHTIVIKSNVNAFRIWVPEKVRSLSKKNDVNFHPLQSKYFALKIRIHKPLFADYEANKKWNIKKAKRFEIPQTTADEIQNHVKRYPHINHHQISQCKQLPN